MHRLNRTDRGSVLLLFPAALLVVLVLASIAVDSAISYLRQREAYNVAYDAANDAVTLGLDRRALDESGEVTVSADLATAHARAAVARARIDGLAIAGVTVDGTTVSVSVTYRVHRIFASVVPGAAEVTTHRITAIVEGRTGP